MWPVCWFRTLESSCPTIYIHRTLASSVVIHFHPDFVVCMSRNYRSLSGIWMYVLHSCFLVLYFYCPLKSQVSFEPQPFGKPPFPFSFSHSYSPLRSLRIICLCQVCASFLPTHSFCLPTPKWDPRDAILPPTDPDSLRFFHWIYLF